MRGKRISDDEIKRFIQSEKERNKSTNQIIKDLRSKGYGVRKQRFLNIYRQVKSENKSVYYVRPLKRIKRKRVKRKISKKLLNQKKKRVKLITIDKEFTSWVKKQNIELDVRSVSYTHLTLPTKRIV